MIIELVRANLAVYRYKKLPKKLYELPFDKGIDYLPDNCKSAKIHFQAIKFPASSHALHEVFSFFVNIFYYFLVIFTKFSTCIIIWLATLFH